MKFIPKPDVVTGKTAIDIVKFFSPENKDVPLCFDLLPVFMQMIRDVTSDSHTVEIDHELFFDYEHMDAISDKDAMNGVKETFQDFSTAEGRLEGRKRIGSLIYFLLQWAKGEKGVLSLKGNSTTVGWFKLSSGYECSLSTNYAYKSNPKQWFCILGPYEEGFYTVGDGEIGARFWSRTKIE